MSCGKPSGANEYLSVLDKGLLPPSGNLEAPETSTYSFGCDMSPATGQVSGAVCMAAPFAATGKGTSVLNVLGWDPAEAEAESRLQV